MARELPSVRDRLWLLAHDDDLRLRSPVCAVGVGLVAAALTDLLIQDRVRVGQGRIYPNGERSGPADDAISIEFLQGVAKAGAPLLAEVLRGAGADVLVGRRDPCGEVYERTRAKLVKDGLLRRQWRMLGRVQYRLAEPDLIGAIQRPVNNRLLRPHESVDLALDVLCAIVWASNMHTCLPVPCTEGEADRALRIITEQIPGRAGRGSPLAIVPHLVPMVRRAIADLTTAMP